MALFTCATVKRIDHSYGTRMVRVDGILFHIAVSNSLFPSYLKGTKAHFYVRKDGTIVQEIDTAFQSGANLQGNPYYISVETEGGVGADVNGSWTPAQVNALATLAREASERHGFPLRQMESSRLGERGVGWHRLGIDGNFPALPSILAGRRQRGGGLLYSSSVGKLCPTDTRIVQIPSIIRIAQNPGDAPAAPNPTPEEDFMAQISDADAQAVVDAARRINGVVRSRRDPKTNAVWSVLDEGDGGAIAGKIDSLATTLNNINNRINYANRPDGTPFKIAVQGDIDSVIAAQTAANAALQSTIQALVLNQGGDPVAIQEAARRGAEEALANLRVVSAK